MGFFVCCLLFKKIFYFGYFMNPLEMGKNYNLEVFDFHPKQLIQESTKNKQKNPTPIIQALIGLH